MYYIVKTGYEITICIALHMFQCLGLVPVIEKVLEQGLEPNTSCIAAKFCTGKYSNSLY